MSQAVGGIGSASVSDRLRRRRARQRAVQIVDRAVLAMAAGWVVVVLTGVLPPSLRTTPSGSPVIGALGLAIVALLTVRRVLDPVTPLREVPGVLRLGEITAWPPLASARFVPVAVVVAAVLMMAGAITRHRGYGAPAEALAVFENVLWNTVHGRVGFSDLLGHRVFTQHFSPVLLILAIPYGIVPRAETLLVIQSVALAAGAFPLARLSRRELGESSVTAPLVIAYLSYLPLRTAARCDFHPALLATPLLLEAFVAMREERWRRAVIAWGLALSCDASVAPVAIMIGGYVALVLNRPKLGGALAIVGVAWLTLTSRIVGAALWESAGGPLGALEHVGGLQGRLNVALPRVAVLLTCFAPLAFLPLLSPLHLLLALPALLVGVVSNADGWSAMAPRHLAVVAPMLFVATTFGAKKLVEREDLRVLIAFYPTVTELERYLAALLLLGAVVFIGWSPIAELRTGNSNSRRDHEEVLALVPAGVPVSAQANLASHLARRRGLVLFPERLAPWIVLDRERPSWPLGAVKALGEWIERARATPGCGLQRERGGVMLFHCDSPGVKALAVPGSATR